MHLRDCSATMIWLPLILFFSVWSAYAEDDAPRIKIDKTEFSTPAFEIQYFDDSDVLLAMEQRGVLSRSTDAGATWSTVDDIKDNLDDGRGPVSRFFMHPYNKEKAYALSMNNVHWFTENRGESWRKFTVPDTDVMPSGFRLPLEFHAGNDKKVIFNGQKCQNPFLCEEISFYTTNDFKDVQDLREDSRGCIWAHASEQSHSERMKEGTDDDRILCVIRGDGSELVYENRLFVSDDFFATKTEPHMSKGRVVKGIINITVVKGYVITAAKSQGSSELALYVSVDGEKWHQAEFPAGHSLNEHEYTILESTNHSIQVDVMNTNPTAPMGVLFSSNSNGTYFTENIRHTNRNFQRLVDFEAIKDIQGIALVNTVKNWQEVERNSLVQKQLQTEISFDDGRTFKSLTVSSGEGSGKTLHLHSVTEIITEIKNIGRVFSSPAPGIVMGVGNTGEYLRSYEEGDLYVSDDAGLTWRRALQASHKYEFGDQGTVLMAVADRTPTNKMSFSLDHGETWTEHEFDKQMVAANILTTVPDSTSLKFLLQATKRDAEGLVFIIYSIDFNGIYDRKCEDDDFEDWHARLNENGEAGCLMGHTQTYRRRRKDAKCFVGVKWKETKPKTEPCKCNWEDYECDFNFKPEGEGESKKCNPTTRLSAPESACREGDQYFKGPSGFRKIPGDDCYEGDRKDEATIDRPCDETKGEPKPDGNLQVEPTRFQSTDFGQKVYLERSDKSGDSDETLLMSTLRAGNTISGIWMSKDHGKQWKQILKSEDNIQYIVQHPYENDRAFFLAPNSKKVWYTVNRGDTFEAFDIEAPMSTSLGFGALGFHPTEKEYLLWTGQQNCGFVDGGDCHKVTYFSDDRGAHWKTIVRYSEKCEFIKEESRGGNKNLLYCVQHKGEKPEGPNELLSSDDFFSNHKAWEYNVLTFATMSEFTIVAEKDPESNLKVKASVDGQNFADAQFPADFNVPVQMAYTLLDSSTHAVFLHVTVGNTENFEYGRIMKSNSNGTSYVLSIDNVNRNTAGYVDFEKMQGVDGVAMVNVVDNVQDQDSGKAKKLRSLITHNDGSEWAPLQAPEKGPGDKEWDCDVNKPEECSLHLHSYTERDDPRHTFTSASGIGLMLGVGNVGRNLGYINDPDNTYTFISRDSGINWKAIKKGRFKWEYGDQGSVIVIVERAVTNIGFYTTDEGATWHEFNFAEDSVQILDITTIPSDNSKQFLIWVRYPNNEVGTINVDFSSIRDNRACVIDENDHGKDDYYLWSPQHPLQSNNCVFGRKISYLRKKPEANCWNEKKDESQHGEITQCDCTSRDFEWQGTRQPDRTCGLVPGFQPKDHEAVCKEEPSPEKYYLPTGYRKIPISECTGGEETKYLGQDQPCPGFEDKWEKEHSGGLSGFAFFLVAILLPISAAAGIGYWVWTHYQRGGFGRIRLGDTSAGSAFDAERPWVKYPVAVVSAIVAVVAAVPLLIGAGWRSLIGLFGGSRRYTTRQSFARGRSDYAVVDPDEDELLGDDDDEEGQP